MGEKKEEEKSCELESRKEEDKKGFSGMKGEVVRVSTFSLSLSLSLSLLYLSLRFTRWELSQSMIKRTDQDATRFNREKKEMK